MMKNRCLESGRTFTKKGTEAKRLGYDGKNVTCSRCNRVLKARDHVRSAAMYAMIPMHKDLR